VQGAGGLAELLAHAGGHAVEILALLQDLGAGFQHHLLLLGLGFAGGQVQQALGFGLGLGGGAGGAGTVIEEAA